MAGNIIRGAEGKASTFKIKGSPRNPLGGMRPDGDPAGHGPTDFVYQKNVRRVGGLVVSRGGQGAIVFRDSLVVFVADGIIVRDPSGNWTVVVSPTPEAGVNQRGIISYRDNLYYLASDASLATAAARWWTAIQGIS